MLPKHSSTLNHQTSCHSDFTFTPTLFQIRKLFFYQRNIVNLKEQFECPRKYDGTNYTAA